MYIHFAFVYKQPLFASKPTFARIDFFGKVSGWWVKWALIMLKFILKSGQNEGWQVDVLKSLRVDKWAIME
ncbi:hypothetical protein HMPREF2955_09745 [Prevotella sp. HMSC073D09]|nr:hypothetical protein HMPREF2955_09745 [Prevotella sp. HMSC073D09]